MTSATWSREKLSVKNVGTDSTFRKTRSRVTIAHDIINTVTIVTINYAKIADQDTH